MVPCCVCVEWEGSPLEESDILIQYGKGAVFLQVGAGKKTAVFGSRVQKDHGSEIVERIIFLIEYRSPQAIDMRRRFLQIIAQRHQLLIGEELELIRSQLCSQ